MNNEQFEAEAAYQVSLSIARSMHSSGLLTHQEYTHLRALLLEKYTPLIGVLFAANY